MEAPRLYWVVGELSGEQHATAVIENLKQRLPTVEMRGMGGPAMAQLGVRLVAAWPEYAVVGFWAVVRHLRKFLRLYRTLQADIHAWQPDRVVLVDYPGLNLRLARWLVRQGIPVTYFIPPQIWAWNTQRVRYLRHPLIEVLCILPFEREFYGRHGVQAQYVGSPLVKKLENIPAYAAEKPYIALLPGSRRHEVEALLPRMAQLPPLLPEWTFIVSKVAHLPWELYQKRAPTLPIVEGQTHQLLRGAAAAVVTSGTATLEAALLGCPSVIVYRGDYLSYWIARQLVKVPFIGLPNLILGEAVFPELIQGACTPSNIATALRYQLQQAERIRTQLHTLREELGTQDAAELVAMHLAERLTERNPA
ncbi:MAG: lipid-A-disaccharide synthase [Bacteroidia bacterium]|nr:lipid-A-disaccharide synthase [Bacteroidia bacterium]GIV23443.1 MAG: lipid-A-disaccharide synthase [Bacteroidia bacterium]